MVQVIHPVGKTAASISVSNLQGTKVMVQQVMPGSNKTELNIGQLPAGSYWVVYQSNGLRMTTRITRL